jgi:PadR family transcriptional regulator PadR
MGRNIVRRKTSKGKISSLEEVILWLLVSNELYGLEIIKGLSEATDGKYKLTFGSLYPTLSRLETKGMINSRWGDDKPNERRGARRKYYKISALGQAALLETQGTRERILQWRTT